MAEDINYASVVFKARENSAPEVKKEDETVYDQVKVKNETHANGRAKADHGPRHQLLLACVLALCVVLLLGSIAAIVWLANLTTQNQDLTTQNQQLETQRNDLTEKIQQMESVEANVSRAEWAVRQYCFQGTGESETSCHSCEKGWLNYRQGCYAYNNLGEENWEGAQKDCEGKASMLAVAHTEAEKEYLRTISVDQKRYWIGLRVVDGKWKWVDGSDLMNTSWVDPPAPSAGHCALSVQKENKWKSVNCSEINPWICGKTPINASTPSLAPSD